MAVTADELVDIAKKHGIDNWRTYDRMRTITNSEPAGTLPRLLWEAFRDKKLDLGALQNGWWDLGEVPDAYTGADFIRLLEAIAKHYSSQPNHYQPWGSDSTPGWPYNMDHVFDSQKDDPDFYKDMADKWQSLPDPYDRALGFRLAAKGAVDVADLPADMLEEYAAHYLANVESVSGVWESIPWPGDIWKKALLTAALGPNTAVIKTYDTLRAALDVASSDEFAQTLQKLGGTTDQTLPPTTEVAARAKDDDALFKALEDALASLDPKDAQPPRWGEASPFFYATFCYLAACEARGAEPAKACDKNIAAFISTYKPTWSGGYFDDYHRRVQALLSLVPKARLEKMFTSAKMTPWLLVGACTTPAVIEWTIGRLVDPPKEESSEYNYTSHVGMGLSSFGAEAVPVIAKAVEGNAGPHRDLLLGHIASYPQMIEAVTGLFACLGDSAKGIREMAIHALPLADHDEVLKRLPDSLGAGRKPEREAAAQVLLALPPSHKRYELAQARIPKEKTKDIKAMLERIEEPGEDAESFEQLDISAEKHEEIVAEMLEHNGEVWENYKDMGEAFLTIFFDVWAKEAGESDASFYRYEGHASLANSWLAFLEHLGSESAMALEYAVLLSGGFSSYYFEEYYKALDEIYGKEAVGAKLADLLSTSRLQRPANFKPLRWGSSDAPKAGTNLLMEAYPSAAAPTVLDLLQDKRKTIRDPAKEFVLAHTDLYKVDDFVPMLTSNRKDTRLTAAELLGVFGDSAAIKPLEAAAKKEKTSDVKDAIALSIVQLNNSSFDPTTYADNKKGDKELDAKLGDLPNVGVPAQVASKIKDLTHPTWKSAGETMSDGAFEWLLSELGRESMEHHGEKLVAVCGRLIEEDLHTLCEELIKTTGRSTSGWTLFMQGVIAPPSRIEETGRHLEEFAQSQSWGWGDHGVEVMVRRGTPQCVRILDDWHHKTRRDALKWRSRAGIQRIADNQGITFEEAIEASISRFGFDDRGEQRYDYGSRTILVKLEPGDDFSYTDIENEKSYKTMPKALKDDNDVLVNEARSEVSRIKKEIKRLRRNQTRRLEDAMATERRWVPSKWRERYALHPVMRSFAQGMVWGIFDVESDELIASVHVDNSGDVVDLEDDTHALDDAKHRLGVVHPARLSAEDRERWIECFVDYEIVQSFDQLMRKVHAKDEWPDKSSEIAAKLDDTSAGSFLGRLDRLGWDKGPREDAGLINNSYRNFGPWSVTLSHDGFSPEYLDGGAFFIQDFSISRDGENVAPKDLPPHIFSEVIHNLLELTEGG